MVVSQHDCHLTAFVVCFPTEYSVGIAKTLELVYGPCMKKPRKQRESLEGPRRPTACQRELVFGLCVVQVVIFVWTQGIMWK